MVSAKAGRRGRRPTIEDVAAAAGVSRGTVSRVINGGADVSAASRGAVERAVRDTGYVANSHARRLAGTRPESIAFVQCVPQENLLDDPNANRLLLDCARALEPHGITLLLPVPFTGADGPSRYLASQAVDGVLLLSMPAGYPLIGDFLARGMPTVAAGAPVGYEQRISYVTVDNREAARDMVRYLHSRGRRRIATITGPLDTDGGLKRLAGYRDVVGAIDDRYVVTGDYSRSSGEAAMDRLLDQAPDLDAVFVASDLMALGAIAALRRRGRAVPHDTAVAGFDDGLAAATAQPHLTTIRQPWQRIGTEMVRLLLGVIAGERQSAVILPHELIVRGSA